MASSTQSLYSNPDLATWLSSFEGVPDRWVQPTPPIGVQSTTLRYRAIIAFERLGIWLPGLALAGAVAGTGVWTAAWINRTYFGGTSPFSYLMLAVVLGLLVRNLLSLPAVYEPGVTVCVKVLLRVGVVLLGIRLNLAAVAQIGLVAVPIIVGCVIAALLATAWIGRRLGIPARLATLIAVGTGICGVSAIVATAPAINAEEDEISYAVATITLFGLAAMFIYPLAAFLMFGGDARHVGYFLGTAIHDTAQVTGAGLMYRQYYDAPAALDAAVVTKLLRNLGLIVIVPMMAHLYHSRVRKPRCDGGHAFRWHHAMPLFVVGFVAMVVIRTVGELGDRAFWLIDPIEWSQAIGRVETVAIACLSLAMAAVGMNTDVRRLARLGPRSFVAGFAAAAVVGGVSVVLIKLISVVVS